MKITMKSIAEEVGVSVPVVSAVINRSNKNRVGDEKREHIIEIIRKYNYRPNQLAQSLHTGRTNMIGIKSGLGTFFGSGDRYLSTVYKGIGSYFSGRHEIKFVFHSFDELLDNDQSLELANGRTVDGIIFIIYSSQLEKFIATQLPFLKKNNFPFTVIHSTSKDLGCFNVGVNCFNAGVTGTEHLISQGYESVGLVCREKPALHDREIMEGYKSAISKTGQGNHHEMIYRVQNFRAAAGKGLIDRLIKENKKLPRAFFTVDDDMAYGMMDGLEEAGISVPGEVALASFGDSLGYLHGINRLTCLQQPAEIKGRIAAKMLERQINDHSIIANPESVIINPELIKRRSS